jgi:hypothetical protein
MSGSASAKSLIGELKRKRAISISQANWRRKICSWMWLFSNENTLRGGPTQLVNEAQQIVDNALL